MNQYCQLIEGILLTNFKVIKEAFMADLFRLHILFSQIIYTDPVMILRRFDPLSSVFIKKGTCGHFHACMYRF